MITDVKIYKDAINAYENDLLKSEANSVIIKFIKKNLNVEKLNLIILTKDQLHHNIFDS